MTSESIFRISFAVLGIPIYAIRYYYLGWMVKSGGRFSKRASRTQPLIRYEVNDRVRLAADTHNSDLPFARIDGIQGRTD